MRPCLISSPSSAWLAASGPERLKIPGSKLGLCGGICSTRKSEAGRSTGHDNVMSRHVASPAKITCSCLVLHSSECENYGVYTARYDNASLLYTFYLRT